MHQILDDQWSLIIPTSDHGHIQKSMMTLSSIWSSMPKKMITPKTDVYIQQLVENAKNGWLIIPQKTDVSLSQADLECREKCKWSSKFSQKITHKLISQADIECREEESGNQADSCQCWEEQVMVVFVMVIWQDAKKRFIMKSDLYHNLISRSLDTEAPPGCPGESCPGCPGSHCVKDLSMNRFFFVSLSLCLCVFVYKILDGFCCFSAACLKITWSIYLYF